MEKREELRCKFFKVEVENELRKGYVYAPSSIEHPHDNTVMFITPTYINKWEHLLEVKDCLIFCPCNWVIPDIVKDKHFWISCDRPRLEFARFFTKNNLCDVMHEKNSSMNMERFEGKNITIMPDTYIGENVSIGNNVYIGSGVRLTGKICIGNNVTIHENSVLGDKSLSFEKDEEGTIFQIPQFGGIEIEDDVTIGSNTVIARGSIDNTIIQKGTMIGSSSSISHNCKIGRNCIIASKVMLNGSVIINDNVWIGPGAIIADVLTIGKGTYIAMGSIVRKSIDEEMAVVNDKIITKAKFYAALHLMDKAGGE